MTTDNQMEYGNPNNKQNPDPDWCYKCQQPKVQCSCQQIDWALGQISRYTDKTSFIVAVDKSKMKAYLLIEGGCLINGKLENALRIMLSDFLSLLDEITDCGTLMLLKTLIPDKFVNMTIYSFDAEIFINN